MNAAKRSDERGFILIAVLWLLVALAAVGLDAGLRGRSERLASANSLDHARAVAAASAGAEYARSRLTAAMLDQANVLRQQAAERNQRNRRGNSRAQSVQQLFRAVNPLEDPWRYPEELMATETELGDAYFRLLVRDTGAALNLNEANETMLRQFFSQGLRLDYALSDRLTQAILDWRDEDEIARVGGGERYEYIREGKAVLPANGPFATLEDLAHVMGMTQEVLDQALPHLTLIGSGRINVNAAPEEVLLAIPFMTRDVATRLLTDRDAGRFPREEDDLVDMLEAATGVDDDDIEDEVEDVVTFTTSEVEIQSVGGVVGSPVTATMHLVVTRAQEGALVVWRAVR